MRQLYTAQGWSSLYNLHVSKEKINKWMCFLFQKKPPGIIPLFSIPCFLFFLNVCCREDEEGKQIDFNHQYKFEHFVVFSAAKQSLGSSVWGMSLICLWNCSNSFCWKPSATGDTIMCPHVIEYPVKWALIWSVLKGKKWFPWGTWSE